MASNVPERSPAPESSEGKRRGADLPASAGRLRRAPLSVAALVRDVGAVAPEALLRARVATARATGNDVEEGAASRELADLLATRGTELHLAVELAQRSLAVEEDPGLRLRLAGWLEGLGRFEHAAAILRGLVDPNDPKKSASIGVRMGVILARAGDASAAREAFLEAASFDEQDALSLELLGVVALWPSDPEDDELRAGRPVSRSSAAYLNAAKRRAMRGDVEDELFDLLRAFELDPSSAIVADALSEALAIRKRFAAADEALRLHARALGPEDSATSGLVHARRRVRAMARGDLARAIAAALDANLDGVLTGEDADALDEWMVRAGMFEALAVRLARRAEGASDAEAARRWADLGRLLSGPLSSPDRAVVAYAKSVAADATNEDALHALRTLSARAESNRWLVEALVRGTLGMAAHGASSSPSGRAAAARALVTFASTENDEALGAFAVTELARLDPTDVRAAEAASSSRSILDESRSRAEALRSELEKTVGGERSARLRELAEILESSPERGGELAAVYEELARLEPESSERWFFDAVRVAERISDFDAVARICRARLARENGAFRARIELVGALLRGEDEAGAAREAAELLATSSPWAQSVAWVTAAVAKRRDLRAKALFALSSSCSASIAGALAVVAAEELEALGDPGSAREAAEFAHRADGSDARILSTLSSFLSASDGKVATTAFERAIAASFPTSVSCARLAHTYERLGDTERALAWTRRLAALRPGDRDVHRILVERAVRAPDAAELADVLAGLIPQPQPADRLAELLGAKLEALGSRDPGSAVVSCQKVLDALGPLHPGLWPVVDHVATAAHDPSLRVKLEERRLSARWLENKERSDEADDETFRLLAALHAERGDVEREIDVVVRASRAGSDLSWARPRMAIFEGAKKSKDAELAWLEARTAMARADGQFDVEARCLRELGAGFWDWANDRTSAQAAWLRASRIDGPRGYRALRIDLSTFGGARYAADTLAGLFEGETDAGRSGLLANEAARAALDAGAFPRALTLARATLDRSPEHAEALEVAERASVRSGRVREMAPLYDQVARSARGRFGRRAAHHRAARYFEAEGLAMLALKHAAQAFIAVPSEGTTLALLERISVRAERRSVAARTLEHVADLSKNSEVRAAWLLRAADLTGKDAEGTRQRFELLLKATALVPSPVVIGKLSSTAKELLRLAPEDGDTMALRLEHASDELAKKLEGPEGARIGIAFAELALSLFLNAGWGWRSMQSAFSADADVEEFARLVPYAAALAAHASAKEQTSGLLEASMRPYANVGPHLFRLVSAIARHLGDGPMSARALVFAAEKEPDDPALVAEADEAVASVGSEELAARFAKLTKNVEERRQSASFRAVSESFDDEPIVQTPEEKPEIAPPEVSEVPAPPAVDAPPAEPSAHDRAQRWVDLANERRHQNDASGAAEALLQAANEESTFARWELVEREAEACGREDLRVEALEKLVTLASPDESLPVRKRLARAKGAQGALAAAESIWRDIEANHPADPDADAAIEALLVARAGYAELVDHLARRAERLANDVDAASTRRAVRLRRVAILEQRLARLDDAARELELLLRESPGNESALRWLVDLHERLGRHDRTIAVLEELTRHPMEPEERESLQIRAVRAMLASHDVTRARSLVADLARNPFDVAAVLELRVELARTGDDANELGELLVALARTSPKDAAQRSQMFVEAAQAAARSGDDAAARERACEGAALAPNVPSVQLFARGLEYRFRGAGTVEDAKATLTSLARLRRDKSIAPEDVALAAFLFAEAEDVLSPGRGEQTLRECLERVGRHPLLALGLAERAARAGRDREALVGYVEALEGNLLGLRSEGSIALAAADLAERIEERAVLVSLLDRAAQDPDTSDEVARRRAALRASAPVAANVPLSQPPRVSIRPAPSTPPLPEPPPVLVADVSTGAVATGASSAPNEGDRVTPVSVVASASAEIGERREASAAHDGSDDEDPVSSERRLFEAAREGSLEAVDALDARLAVDRTRNSELLAVRRRGVELTPGDLKRLAKLRDAVRLDQNTQLLQAVEHVMAAFDATQKPVPPPPLGAQDTQPGMLTLLSRHSLEPMGEALGIVWENARNLFVKSWAAYGMTGLERVVPGPMSPLSRLYEVTLRLLDTPKFALFHRRSPDAAESVSVALLTHPCAVLSGDAREDTPLVRWQIGAALAHALPENALLFGLSEPESRSLLEVLSAAFGPPGKSIDRAQAQVAETLWQTLPPRAQRRLQEIFAAHPETPYELVLERAKQSGRRVGMFLTGDFADAARRVVLEADRDARELDVEGGLAHLCAELPALADLLRLAVTPEYADARWRKPTPTSMRFTLGRTSLV